MFRCEDCDEDCPLSASKLHIAICNICGAYLTKINPTVSPPELSAQPTTYDLLDLIGVDLRDEIRDYLAQYHSSKKISLSYLNTLGKVILDKNMSIVRDISLSFGPLQCLAVPASFVSLPKDPYCTVGSIVTGIPLCGESPLTNAAMCLNAIVLLDRGDVSFVAKSVRAMEAGAIAVVICQTVGVWPFVMTDNSNELFTLGVEMSIPVVMISKKDADILRKLITELGNNKTARKLEIGSERLSAVATLKFGEMVQDCSICQECFKEGDNVIKLPCRHIYHTDCVTSWLQQNNTCPLCRLQLPKNDTTIAMAATTTTNNEIAVNNFYA